MRDSTRLALAAGLLLSGLVPLAIVALPIAAPRLVLSLLLISFLPGWALVEGLFAGSEARPGLGERLLLGLGASYVVTIVGGLWLYYGLGHLSRGALLGLYAAVGLAGFGWALAQRLRAGAPATGSRPGWRQLLAAPPAGAWWLLGLLLFAAYFRFYFLSYSDLRGDEAEVVLRATAAIRGQGQPILSHTKGPAETLLAAAVALLYGSFEELTTRLPFALGNWLAVAGTYLLGRRLFNGRAALIGGALVAINGWFITYGRTAQYQDLVLPMSVLAVWCYLRFYQGGSQRYLWLGGLLLATATFGHYEGASAGPAALYLLLLGLRKRPDWRRQVWPAALSLLAAAAVTLSFYAPFVLNPTVAGAQGHVAKRFGGSPPYNNWDAFYVNGLFYNSIYYVLGLGAILLAGALAGIRRSLGRGRWRGLATLAAAPVLLLSWTGLLPPWYALLVFLGLMGLFLASGRVGPPVKAMLLWLVLPFGLYLFAVELPGNHYYVFMPPLMLLAALTLDRGRAWLAGLRRPPGRAVWPALAGALLVLFGLSTWYEHLVFMRTDLEYLLTYPRHRQPLFWSDPRYPFDIRIGWGFPYRLGWQTVAELYRRGELAGDWYSTDENNSLFWYTLGSMRNPCYPRYFMLTEYGYHEPALEVPQDVIDRHYTLRATVAVNDQPRLRLYEFTPLGSDQEPAFFNEPARYGTPYRPEMLQGDPLAVGQPEARPEQPLAPPSRFKPHPDMLAQLIEVYGDERIVQVQDEVSLLGYDVDETWAVPGGVLLLTLYWQADRPTVLPYKVFTHLEDRQLWAQADDEPGCANFPTYRWRPGRQVIDRHAIFLPEDLPPGEYPIQLGLYEVRSGLRMDLLDQLGNPAGNALILPAVTVSPRPDQAVLETRP